MDYTDYSKPGGQTEDNHENNTITNCITFTCCREGTNKVAPEIRESVPLKYLSADASATTSPIVRETIDEPRRSIRLASLKTNVD